MQAELRSLVWVNGEAKKIGEVIAHEVESDKIHQC